LKFAKERHFIATEKYSQNKRKQEDWVKVKEQEHLQLARLNPDKDTWYIFKKMPCGIGYKIHFYYVKHYDAHIKARADLAHQFMSVEEKAILKAEEKQLEAFGSGFIGELKKRAYKV
jgi:hypothetical protein